MTDTDTAETTETNRVIEDFFIDTDSSESDTDNNDTDNNNNNNTVEQNENEELSVEFIPEEEIVQVKKQRKKPNFVYTERRKENLIKAREAKLKKKQELIDLLNEKEKRERILEEEKLLARRRNISPPPKQPHPPQHISFFGRGYQPSRGGFYDILNKYRSQ